jgi:putative transposase
LKTGLKKTLNLAKLKDWSIKHRLALARRVIERKDDINKSLLCRILCLNRSSLYYESILDSKDQELATQIQFNLIIHPFYGAKRLALELSEASNTPVNHKRVSRVMVKYNLNCQRRTTKPRKPLDLGNLPMSIPNLLKPLIEKQSGNEKQSGEYRLNEQNAGVSNAGRSLEAPNQVWCSDFTYLWWEGSWKYLFTILDAKTREVLNFNLTNNHESHWLQLTIEQAIAKHGTPEIFHSDQGSEYTAEETIQLLTQNNIQVSMSKKASPWENGYQESFYGNFKPELEYRIQTEMQNKHDEAELYELVAKQINYYNNHRLHTAIKDKPARYREKLLKDLEENRLSRILGG